MKNKNWPTNRPKNRKMLYNLLPILPGNDNIGPLKDLAQDIIAVSARLEGKVARETALAVGDHW